MSSPPPTLADSGSAQLSAARSSGRSGSTALPTAGTVDRRPPCGGLGRGGRALADPEDSPRGRRAAAVRAGPIGTPAVDRPHRVGPQRRRGGSRDLPVAPAGRHADPPPRPDPAQLRLRPRVPSPARRPVAPDPGAQGGRRPAHAPRETLPLDRRDVVAPTHHELLDVAPVVRRPDGAVSMVSSEPRPGPSSGHWPHCPTSAERTSSA